MKYFTFTKNDITEPIIIRQESNDPRESENMRVWHSCLMFGKKLIFEKGYSTDQLLTYIASQVGTHWDEGFWWSLESEFYKAHVIRQYRENQNSVE